MQCNLFGGQTPVKLNEGYADLDSEADVIDPINRALDALSSNAKLEDALDPDGTGIFDHYDTGTADDPATPAREHEGNYRVYDSGDRRYEVSTRTVCNIKEASGSTRCSQPWGPRITRASDSGGKRARRAPVGTPQPRCPSRGPSRGRAATKLSAPTGPRRLASRYCTRQPWARPAPSGCPARNRSAHSRRWAGVWACSSHTSPSCRGLPANWTGLGPRPRWRQLGTLTWIGGKASPNCFAKRGRALRAEAAHSFPRGLRHPALSHNSRPETRARESAPLQRPLQPSHRLRLEHAAPNPHSLVLHEPDPLR